MPVSQEDETHEALRSLGHSIGVIALGRRIVLIEGTDTSLDKQTYGAILRDSFPELVLIPSEGRGVIGSFSTFNERILKQSIWGVEFFMLCDRDAVPPHRDAAALEAEANSRFRVLDRYHLENYFLDEECLAAVFEPFEPAGSWLRDASAIRNELAETARASLSYATALYASAQIRDLVGNVDVMPKGCHAASKDELVELFGSAVRGERERVAESLSDDCAREVVTATWKRLKASLEGDEWKSLFPGRRVLRAFADKAGLGYGRLKTGFLQASRKADDRPFAKVVEVFSGFDNHVD